MSCKAEETKGGQFVQLEMFPNLPGGQNKRKPGRPSSGVPRAEQNRIAARKHYAKMKKNKETA